jgi:hypothetical protein
MKDIDGLHKNMIPAPVNMKKSHFIGILNDIPDDFDIGYSDKKIVFHVETKELFNL